MATRPAGTPAVAVNGVSYQTWLKRKRANPKLKDNTWRGYVSYVAQNRNQKAASRIADMSQIFGKSYFQVDPQRYARQVGRYLPQTPDYVQRTPDQLRLEAQQQILPLYSQQADAITKMIQERSRSGSAAIQGYTNAYLSTLPQVQADISNIWGEARNLQQASSGALGDFVRNQGASLTNELAQAERQAGQTSAGSQMVGQVAAGSANATAANDWSTMARLINQGAGAQTYAAQLPAIAGAYGADTMRSFQSDLNRELSGSLDELKLAGQRDIVSMYQTLLDRELQRDTAANTRRDARGQAIAGAYSDAFGMNQDARLAGAAIAANLLGQAEGYTQETFAGMNPQQPTTKQYPPGYDPVTGDPIVPRITQIRQRWAEAMPGIASAVSQMVAGAGGVDPNTGRMIPAANFNQLMRRILPLVRAALGEYNLTEGQLRGFARQALAANNVFPGTGAKPKPTGKGKPVAGNTQAGRAPATPPIAIRNSGTIQGPSRTRIRVPGIPVIGDLLEGIFG